PLDALVVLANLLPQGVVRHQRLDNRRSRETGDGETLNPAEKVTAIDLAMNKLRVQFHRFRGNFPRLCHRDLPHIPPYRAYHDRRVYEAVFGLRCSAQLLDQLAVIQLMEPP